MNSMTGHGRGRARVAGVSAAVECFSVNRKSAEVALAAPRELFLLEPKVREAVLARVARGRVTVAITIENSTAAAGPLVDHSRAKAYLSELRTLQKSLKLSGDIPLKVILAGPGVLAASASTQDPWPAVNKALATALDGLLAMRAREGGHLHRELVGLARQLDKLAAKVRPLASRVPGCHRAALLERLERSGLPWDVAEPRVAVEIAMLAERCDISEELTRLASHAAQFHETTSSDGTVGRTLEFLVQEMAREWNTIGSKANDAGISRLVVGAKATLDKLREQLANIE